MRVYNQPRFAGNVLQVLRDFTSTAEPVDVGQWHSASVKGDSQKVTWELREAVLAIQMGESIEWAKHEFQPNLPWAEDHFLERVGGLPYNPPPSQAWWPFIQNGHSQHINDGQFSHTYPERFWPKHAGHHRCTCPHQAELEDRANPGHYSHHWNCQYGNRRGIRFEYGDLADVVARMVKNPLTRQAYLPVWFPEDTGAPEGKRVPCSLGYHFMIRNDKLHVTYHIRSCDFMRHFRDDVYMAVRLGQWMRDQVDLGGIEMGELTMHIGSFHIFEGDRFRVRQMLRDATVESNEELARRLGS